MAGVLATEQLLSEMLPSPAQSALWEEIEAELALAVQTAPTSAFVWELYGRYLDALGRSAEANNAFASSLQLNPANVDAKAAFGRMLLLNGPSELGSKLAQDAVLAGGVAPGWYHVATAVEALRNGDDAKAMLQASLVARADTEIASVIATAASRRHNAEAELNRSLAQLLEVTRFKRFGILPVVRQRIRDAALVETIADLLRAAGVTDQQLNRGTLD